MRTALPRALALFAAVPLGACDALTQLVVVVDSDYGDELRGLGVELLDASGGSLQSHRFELEQTPLPLSFAITPGDAFVDQEVTIVLRARDGTGGELSHRRARVGFVRGKQLLLAMFLPSRCRAAPCSAEGTTCTPAGCESDRVDAASLPPLGDPGDELRIDAGMPVADAGAPDAEPLDADGPDADTPVDATPTDADTPDAGPQADADPADSAPRDADAPDAAPRDADAPDADAPDATPPRDADTPDATPPRDADTPDATPPRDAEPVDLGIDAGRDAGPDAGRDAGPDAGRDAGPDAGNPATCADCVDSLGCAEPQVNTLVSCDPSAPLGACECLETTCASPFDHVDSDGDTKLDAEECPADEGCLQVDIGGGTIEEICVREVHTAGAFDACTVFVDGNNQPVGDDCRWNHRCVRPDTNTTAGTCYRLCNPASDPCAHYDPNTICLATLEPMPAQLGLCLPRTVYGDYGQVCTSDGECQTGKCVNAVGLQVCGFDCSSGQACPIGLRCDQLLGLSTCVRPCTNDGDCTWLGAGVRCGLFGFCGPL